MLTDPPAVLAAVRALFGGAAPAPPPRSAAEPLTLPWGATAPFLDAPELSLNVAYAEREGEFDVASAEDRRGEFDVAGLGGGAGEGEGAAAAAPPPGAVSAGDDDGGDIDVLHGFFSPFSGAPPVPAPSPAPASLVAPLGRANAPPLASGDAVLQVFPGDAEPPAPMLPLCLAAPLAVPEAHLRGGGGGGGVRLLSTLWLTDPHHGGVPQPPPAPPLLWPAAAAAAAGAGPRAPPTDALLRAALQAEGLRGLSCATERRVATFMLG
jgi:hypothetical protein